MQADFRILYLNPDTQTKILSSKLRNAWLNAFCREKRQRQEKSTNCNVVFVHLKQTQIPQIPVNCYFTVPINVPTG